MAYEESTDPQESAPVLNQREPAAAEETGRPGMRRLVSLDVFRGWTMFWIVGGAAILEGLQHLSPNPVTNAIAYELTHTEWHGLRFYDLIWPSFMLMTGMSLAFSYAKRSLSQSHAQIFHRVLQRFAVLFLLGSLRESISFHHPYLIELSSALQPIAVAYLAAFLLVRKSWKVQAGVGAAILIGYALVLAFVSVPGVPAGSYRQDLNLVLWSDLATVGRVLPEHWGTVICTAPTISTTILGMLLGELLMTTRSSRSKMTVIAAVGASGVLLGFALDPVIPIVMKMWTTTYGLASAGWACLMFLFFYWVVDVRGARKWAFPFVVFGANAVAIYMSQSIVHWGQIVSIFTAPLSATLGSLTPLCTAMLTLVVEWLVLHWMYKRKIFLTA
jgi:predicted acyltransferase